MTSSPNAPSVRLLLEQVQELLHSASLLDEAPLRWTTLVALRSALAPFIPADQVEIVYRDPREACHVSTLAESGRTDLQRALLKPREARARMDEVAETGAASMGRTHTLIAPLNRHGSPSGFFALRARPDFQIAGEHLRLASDIAQLLGAGLATELQTEALGAQTEIAQLLARGESIANVWTELTTELRRILHWERAEVVARRGDAHAGELIVAAGLGADSARFGAAVSLLPEGVVNAHEGQGSLFTSALSADSGGEFELRSRLSVPLYFDGQMLGQLDFGTRREDAYVDSDLERMRGVATLVAGHMAFQRNVRRLQSSEAEYRALYHQIAATHTQLLQAEKLASVGQLAAGVAHEINNPAAVVMSNLSHLSITLPETRRVLGKYRAALRVSDPASSSRIAADEQAMDLRALENEIDDSISESLNAMRRIRDIVRSLMRFARGPGPTPELVSLRDVAERAIMVSQNEIRHRARLSRDYQSVATILGDPSSLEQVVVNVLLNAAQALPEGSAESHEIRLRITDDEGHAVLEIADDGQGIPHDVLPRVFDPFFTTKPVGQGTGLGLSIAHDVITKHNGEIGIESVPGQGTTVRIKLPLASRPAAAPLAEPRPKPKRTRVMIVDDEVPVLRAAERLLRNAFETVCAASGDAALRGLRDEPAPDVILCDLMMPAMTGMDLYEQIVERHPELERRVLFMTGGAFTPRARAFAERMSGRIVEKPLEGRELHDLILRQVSHLRGEAAEVAP